MAVVIPVFLRELEPQTLCVRPVARCGRLELGRVRALLRLVYGRQHIRGAALHGERERPRGTVPASAATCNGDVGRGNDGGARGRCMHLM